MNLLLDKLKTFKTLPNKLTAARIAVIPILLLVYPLTHEMVFFRFFCAGLFTLAALTDFFDGYLARKYGNVSKIGALLDPIADKILVAATIVILAGAGYMPIFIGGILLCREVAISGLRMAATELRFSIDVSDWGKFKTVAQDVAFFCLMVHTQALQPIGIAALWIALGLSLYSAYRYVQSFWEQGKSIFIEAEGSPADDGQQDNA